MCCCSSTEKPTFIDIIISDFDGVKFHIWSEENANNMLTISMYWDIVPTLLKQGGQAKLQKEYGAFLAKQPEDGYHITLKVRDFFFCFFFLLFCLALAILLSTLADDSWFATARPR